MLSTCTTLKCPSQYIDLSVSTPVFGVYRCILKRIGPPLVSTDWTLPPSTFSEEGKIGTGQWRSSWHGVSEISVGDTKVGYPVDLTDTFTATELSREDCE